MSVEHTISGYLPRKPSVEEAIDAKMKVLEEFYVVTNENRDEIRRVLKSHIAAHPNRDYELALDQIAHKLIKMKLDDDE